MKQVIKSGLRFMDRTLAAAALRLKRERPALLAFMFHSLFEDEREVGRGLVDPYQAVLVSDFKRFIEHFLEHGYRFVSPAEILAGLDATGHYVFTTFDDGYANNLRAIPVLSEFGVPATFFVSIHHIAEGKAFWWDALYRERHRRGVPEAAIQREQTALRRRSYREIEAYLRAEFSEHALVPIDSTDRPMTPTELKKFASEPLVTLGNHTADHIDLTTCDNCEVRSQIRACQDYLAELTGAAPQSIAYPYGNYDGRVLQVARSEGLLLGVTVEPRKNRLPLANGAEMAIARYSLSGGPALVNQCQAYRSDIQLRHVLRQLRTSVSLPAQR